MNPLERIITVVSAVTAPVLSLLIDENVIAATTATDIGAIIAALVAGYHGGKAVERRTGTSGKR